MNATGARIVNVGSAAADPVKHFSVDDLQLRRGWTMMNAYSQSKLALLMATSEWARRLKGTGISRSFAILASMRNRAAQNRALGPRFTKLRQFWS